MRHRTILQFLAVAALARDALAFVAAQDTVHVRADEPPVWGPDVRLVEEFSIGTLDGPAEYSFGQLGAAAVDPRSGFYLFDRNDIQIRRYDARGRFVGAIGRKGAGPGEYQAMAAMAVTRDGLLIVFDPPTARITYFRPDGSVQREISLTRTGFYGSNFIIDTTGSIYLTVSIAGGSMEGRGTRLQYVRPRPDGTMLDSLPHPLNPWDFPLDKSFSLVTSDGMRWNFTERSIVAPYTPGGVLSANTHHYRFVVTTPDRRSLVVERKHEPVPLGRDERAEWVAWAEYFRTRPGGAARQYEIPRMKPAIRSLSSDKSGRIWVDVFVSAERRNETPRGPGDARPLLTWKERTTYDVFSPKGAYPGRVALPAESVILAIQGERLYLRTKGPEGEDRVGVYRMIVRGERGRSVAR